MPELIENRAHFAAFSFNESYVYALGGFNGINEMNSLEKISVNRLDKWERVKIAGFPLKYGILEFR